MQIQVETVFMDHNTCSGNSAKEKKCHLRYEIEKSQLTLMSIKEKTTKGLIYLLEKIIYYHLEYSLVTAGGDFITG